MKKPSVFYSGTVGEADTDVALFREGYVTITPLKCDETNEASLDRIAKGYV